jgi:hypothetical protein
MLNRRNFLKKILSVPALAAFSPNYTKIFNFSGEKNKIAEKFSYPQREWPNSEKIGDFERSLDYLSPARRIFLVDELPDGALPVYVLEKEKITTPNQLTVCIAPMFFSPIHIPQNWEIVFGAHHMPHYAGSTWPVGTEVIDQFEINHWTKKTDRECYVEIFESILKQETLKMVELFDEVVSWNKNIFEIRIKDNINKIYKVLGDNCFGEIEKYDRKVTFVAAHPETIELLEYKDRNGYKHFDRFRFSNYSASCRYAFWGNVFGADILVNENIPKDTVYFTAEGQYGLIMPIRQKIAILKDDRNGKNGKSVGYEEIGMACLNDKIVSKMTIK